MAKKSITELMRQVNRMHDNPRMTQSRLKAVYDSYYKYVRNIGGSKSYNQTYEKARRDYENFIGVNRGSDFNANMQYHADNVAMGRRYSMTKHAQWARAQRAKGLNGG